MRKEDALRILFQCADLFNKNLLNRNILFLYVIQKKELLPLETVFKSGNFLHMTGVKFLHAPQLTPNEFFSRCLDRRLTVNDFDYAPDGTTLLKLAILPKLLSKNLNAKMVADFKANRPMLYTEKLAGGVTGCIGFVKDDHSSFYAPNTLLKEDIRSISSEQMRIVAAYQKTTVDSQYSERVYLAKGVKLGEYTIPSGLEYLRTVV